MTREKLLKQGIEKAIFCVKEAEKLALDTDYSGKLDIVKDLMAVESQLKTIGECVHLPIIKIDTNTKINDLEDELSVRTRVCIMRAGCNTIGDVISHTEEEAMRFRNLGRKSLQELIDFLEDHGLAMKKEQEDSDGEEH